MPHFPENCKYVLGSNSPDYIHEFGELVHRQDHLSKLESKIHEEGEQNFVGNRKFPPERAFSAGEAPFTKGVSGRVER
ncbi:YagK/YfjJ domain-containing protein [Escherichia coli]|uniref:YagK/YfjJ domain-containing protein n=1 Tax=Escherichia coli TaxID=562 RepID=UPI00227D90EB|nr:inovirus-type Gp2 protein [Escherichia coli]